MSSYDTFIAEIRSNIAPVLKSDFAGMEDNYAREIAQNIDYTDDTAHIEVRGLHTKTGAPHAFTLDIPAALRED